MGESATEIFTPHMKPSAPNTPCSCGQIFTEICLYFDLAVITLCSALCSSVDLVSICSRHDVAARWSTWKPLIQSMSITLMQHLSSYLLSCGFIHLWCIFHHLYLSCFSPRPERFMWKNDWAYCRGAALVRPSSLIFLPLSVSGSWRKSRYHANNHHFAMINAHPVQLLLGNHFWV